jgi:hypothetical protein
MRLRRRSNLCSAARFLRGNLNLPWGQFEFAPIKAGFYWGNLISRGNLNFPRSTFRGRFPCAPGLSTCDLGPSPLRKVGIAMARWRGSARGAIRIDRRDGCGHVARLMKAVRAWCGGPYYRGRAVPPRMNRRAQRAGAPPPLAAMLFKRGDGGAGRSSAARQRRIM